MISGRDDDLNKIQSEFCKVVTHPSRIKIIHLLGEAEMSVSEIVEKIGQSQSNVSQHLTILKMNKIIEERREGQKIYYRLSNHKIIEACNIIREILAVQNEKEARSTRSALRQTVRLEKVPV